MSDEARAQMAPSCWCGKSLYSDGRCSGCGEMPNYCDGDKEEGPGALTPPMPKYGQRAVPCADHDDLGTNTKSHEADLLCAARAMAMCGGGHVGHDCGCDYFDLRERKYASELYPESYS